MENLLTIAKNTACHVRDILMEKSPDQLAVIDDDNKDIKLAADFIAHNYIIDVLDKTNIPVFSEECENIENFTLNKYQWIIDPLDGTLNYFRGFKMSAVSISLWEDGEPKLGVIAPVFSNDIYFAEKGRGAWKNDDRIFVSKTNKKKDAVLVTGFPSGRNYAETSLLNTLKNISEYKKVRMIGSAAMMLNMVASGIFDVYEEEDIFIWDVAAGLALVREAGGSFSMNKGNNTVKYNVRASNKNLFNVL